MAKPTTLEEFFKMNNEMQFDNRLLDKRVEHGFLTRDQRATWLKGLPEETDYVVVTPEELEKNN